MAKNTDEEHIHHQSANVENLETSYGEDYLKWKSWEGIKFGTLKRTESAYFTAEISRTKYNFPQNSKVLEIGFGNGAFLKYALEKQWDVLGIEINQSLVRIAKERGFSATHTDNLSSFEDNSFDLIVAFDVLEHVPQESIPNMILEVKRILKSDRFFIARFPNGDSPIGLINQNGDITHLRNL